MANADKYCGGVYIWHNVCRVLAFTKRAFVPCAAVLEG